jgi:molybdopterin converting factor small subunit
MNTHSLSIHLYANLKEKAGTNLLQFEVPVTCTVTELKGLLKQAFPALSSQLNKIVVTVNGGQVFIEDEVLPLNADVTLLPPFGGG